jgi:hypothetical protein
VAALIQTSAFTRHALDFAIDRLRREVVGQPKERLTKVEIAMGRLRGRP